MAELYIKTKDWLIKLASGSKEALEKLKNQLQEQKAKGLVYIKGK